MTSLTPTALTFEDVLRALGGPWTGTGNTLAQVVTRTGRDKSNLRRDLGKLVELGLAEGDTALGWVRSKAGTDALNAIDRANGFVPAGAMPLWPLDKIEFNPDNPRKAVAQEPLEGLADTIASAEGLLQPIVLYPAGANGVRMLHAGERRVRACRLLKDEGRLPPALEAGLPFLEREATKAEALFIGLVENSQRENLTAFEDAQALKAFQDETGLSARAIAFKLGRAREGSEEGVRDVQEKIKTLTRAKPEAVERVKAGRESFDWLRQQVRKRLEDVGQQLRPIDILTLAEVKLRARKHPKRHSYGYSETECSYTAGKDPVLKGLVSQGLLGFTEQARDDHKAYVEVRHTASALFNTEELAGIHADIKVAAQLVHTLRVAALGEAKAQELSKGDRYATEWLNGPFAFSGKAQTLVEQAKATKRELMAANKIKRTAHNARVQEATAIVVQVEERGLSLGLVDKVSAQLKRSNVEFPLRVSGKNIEDAKGDALFWNGLGWRFAEDQEALLPLLCVVLNSVLAPTPLEAAIAKATPVPETPPAAKDAHLDRTEYTSAVAAHLAAVHGWHLHHATKHAPTAVEVELEAYRIDFGDENYSWDLGAAKATADDYADQNAAPIATVAVVNNGTITVPVEHWEDPDAWIAANIRNGELVCESRTPVEAVDSPERQAFVKEIATSLIGDSRWPVAVAFESAAEALAADEQKTGRTFGDPAQRWDMQVARLIADEWAEENDPPGYQLDPLGIEFIKVANQGDNHAAA